MNEYAQQLSTVAQCAPDERATFIRKTYAHLAGAVLAFIGLEVYMINSPIAQMLLNVMTMRFGWLMILGGFIIFGRLASGLASSTASQSMQYVGLTLYVILESVIFAPILYIAACYSSPEVIPTAGILTLGIFAGLTLVVFTTKKDFSFLRGILSIGFMVALGLIVCAVLFGFNLGLLFSFAMVLLASGAILYDTSKILHHYAPGQHVAASLQLFASVALLFWYVLQIVMSLSRR
ncbi:MAG: Bax inhibitor-1 family protein [Kiritimatiellaceae bacterium]|nr:Bax inhibitor-1 family protein [Kiritimatiellaceae bacterium]